MAACRRRGRALAGPVAAHLRLFRAGRLRRAGHAARAALRRRLRAALSRRGGPAGRSRTARRRPRLGSGAAARGPAIIAEVTDDWFIVFTGVAVAGLVGL